MKLELRKPRLDLAKSFLDFTEEMRRLGETVWEGMVPFPEEEHAAFIQRLLAEETVAREGLVPQTTHWAVLDNQVVGRIALRHHLNKGLEEFGGHIGYEVRPSKRRMGIATEMLKQLLATSRAKSIGKLLLTCAPDNIASNKTIRSNGGALAKTAFVQSKNRLTNYYWIELISVSKS